MSWKLLVDWLGRWIVRQPVAWAFQLSLLAGVLLSIGLSPLRWIQPSALNVHQLRAWLPAWLLLGVFLSWGALKQAQPVRYRLSPLSQVVFVGSVIALISLLNLGPWMLLCVLLAEKGQVLGLSGLAFQTALVGFGPAVAIGLSRGFDATRIAGLIVVLGTWSVWEFPTSPSIVGLLLALLLAAGWVLLGVAVRATQPQPL